MDFGIALAASADAWKTIQRAEALGFSHAWLYDSQMLCADPLVALAAAAAKTERIQLGTGVLIPSNRIAPSAANAFATLSALAPGRVHLGIGTGFTGRRTMGLGAIRLADLEEYLRVMRGLLAGETVEWEFEGKRQKLRFLNPEAGVFNLEDPIPVHLSAFGPRGRRLAAEQADGWMTFAFGDAGAIADLGSVAEACRAAGREADSLYTTVFTLGCVLDEGEAADGPRARAEAGPQAACLLHNFVEAEAHGSVLELPPALTERVAAYGRVFQGYEPADARYLTLHRGHLMFVRPEEEPFLDAELIGGCTFTGTAEALRDRIRALRDAGYRQWTIQLVHGHEDAIDRWADVVAKI